MKTTAIKKVFALLAAAFVFFTVYAGSLFRVSASAADGVTYYDETDIMDDLVSLPIEDMVNMVTTSPTVLQFSEFCYPDEGYAAYEGYYGLYVYIYSPSGKEIEKHGNVINMATMYNEDGEVDKYSNVPLTLLDTAGGIYKNKLFKFKVNAPRDGTDFLIIEKNYAKNHEGKRRYDINGIQLCFKDNANAMDYTYGKTYYFSGYGKGLSDESKQESTLTAEVQGLKTLELELEHTYYRTGVYQSYVCDQLNTVYFSLPDEYYKVADGTDEGEFVGLRGIDAEWYEYKTTPMFVTEDKDAYAALKANRGKDYSLFENNSNPDFKWRVIWEEDFYVITGSSYATNTYRYYKAYNPYANNKDHYTEGVLTSYYWNTATKVPRLDWIFEVDGLIIDSIDDFRIPTFEVKKYMEEYTKAFSNTDKIRGYSKNLFSSTVDEGRTLGYNRQTITSDDTRELTFTKDQSWWDRFWKGVKYEEKGYDPIIILSDDIRNLTVEKFAGTYLIDKHEAQTVYDNCIAMLNNGQHPVLFRFAVTDYYASAARFDKAGDGTGMSGIDGYVAQQTAFLDFDVISLTFEDEKGQKVLVGVTVDPIDIINGLDAPTGMPVDDWDWETILGLIFGAIGLIILLVILGPILPYVIKGIVWIVVLPFKGLTALFKGIASLFEKNKKE